MILFDNVILLLYDFGYVADKIHNVLLLCREKYQIYKQSFLEFIQCSTVVNPQKKFFIFLMNMSNVVLGIW